MTVGQNDDWKNTIAIYLLYLSCKIYKGNTRWEMTMLSRKKGCDSIARKTFRESLEVNVSFYYVTSSVTLLLVPRNNTLMKAYKDRMIKYKLQITK